MQALPGFRDFFPVECARRNYIVETWRAVARRYGFVEYDGPVVEPLALYEKKSGGELVGQLFTVGATADPGENKGVLRPEMTPTLARMVVARQRDFTKPMKWFCAPTFFRHERKQRGRLREFVQLNLDIIGEPGAGADGELLAVLIDTLRAFGFGAGEVVVRLSDRRAWAQFGTARGLDAAGIESLLGIVDKMERTPEEETARKLSALGLALADVRAFIANPLAEASGLAALIEDLRARGMAEFVELDLTIVRGLAYYTGVVFEVFDRARTSRAVAGGGRYDELMSVMSDGKIQLPALGFGMGDVVLGDLIEENEAARAQRDAWIAAQHSADVYVVVANEARRPDALALVQQLRESGLRVDYALAPAKVGKQFQSAETAGAKFAAVVGDEWPLVKLKRLSTREETQVAFAELKSLIVGQVSKI